MTGHQPRRGARFRDTRRLARSSEAGALASLEAVGGELPRQTDPRRAAPGARGSRSTSLTTSRPPRCLHHPASCPASLRRSPHFAPKASKSAGSASLSAAEQRSPSFGAKLRCQLAGGMLSSRYSARRVGESSPFRNEREHRVARAGAGRRGVGPDIKNRTPERWPETKR